jgi:hypothetical protein
MGTRATIPDFQLANPLYVSAEVAFYTVDVNGVKTTTLATLYTNPTGVQQASNPQTLDSEGKFIAPVYIDAPVIGEVTGSTVGSHDTGVIAPLRGAWRGDWTTGTVYNSGDLIRDPATFNLYAATADYTAGASVAADVSGSKLELVFDFVAVSADAATIAADKAACDADAATAAADAATATTQAGTATTQAGIATSEAGTATTQAATATAAAATATSASRGLNIINGYIKESHAASAVTFAVKTLANADPSAGDPVVFVFPTSGGSVATVSVTAALSLTISSGSLMGASNTVPFKLWLVAFNDGGTVRIGAINCLSGTSIYPLGQYPFASSTTEGGAGGADNAQVFYTGTGVTTKAYSILGYATYSTGLTTAGTWDASPDRMVLYQAGMKLPGDVVQTAGTATGAVATGTTVIPQDDTIPQNTEGDQYMSQAITPTSAANLLEATSLAFLTVSSSSYTTQAMFRDSVSNALIAAWSSLINAIPFGTPMRTIVLAGAVTATTFKLRAGGTAGTTTFNGSGGSREFGGVFNSYLSVKEYVA